MHCDLRENVLESLEVKFFWAFRSGEKTLVNSLIKSTLEAFERFIREPGSFELRHPDEKVLEDLPKLNQKYVEGQIINQRSLRNDLQQKIKNCGRKVRSQCKRFSFKADNSGVP